MPLDNLDHAFGYLGLELAIHVEHGLGALHVQLLNCRPIGLLHRVAQKLLQHAVLLLGGIAGQVERHNLVGSHLRGRHGHRFLCAWAHCNL